MIQSKKNDSISSADLSVTTRIAIAQFCLSEKNPYIFSLKRTPLLTITPKRIKNHAKAGLETTAINLSVWAFNKYFKNHGWADISLDSILKNLKQGFEWDDNSFQCNQFSHPYHGAMYHSAARANGLNFIESSVYTALGSLMWEVILETNRPSANDCIMTIFGGMVLGEALYKIAELIYDRSSFGFERTLRNALAFLINPVLGIKIISGNEFSLLNPTEKHHYSFKFPIGFYSLPTTGAGFFMATHLEYKGYLEKQALTINPYDWFSFDISLGIYDYGIRDMGISITGVLGGKKVKNALFGLYGVFEYIDTRLCEKISCVGVGPGLVTNSESDSGLFLKSHGILSLIFGGTSPSFDSQNYQFGRRTRHPYYLGPGLLGRIKTEFGKDNIGSIGTSLSQYWIHSLFTHANEFLTVLSFNFKCPFSNRAEISLGYEYYIRNASYHETRLSRKKHSVQASYVFKF